MIVVADTGPLHYLILLQHIELLQRFYGQVLIPEPVASELSAAGAPAVVRWMTKPPTWIDVRPVPSEACTVSASAIAARSPRSRSSVIIETARRVVCRTVPAPRTYRTASWPATARDTVPPSSASPCAALTRLASAPSFSGHGPARSRCDRF